MAVDARRAAQRSPRSRRLALAVLSAAAMLVPLSVARAAPPGDATAPAPAPSSADFEPPVAPRFSTTWSYRRFGGWDYAITLAAAAVALGSHVSGPPSEARWTGGILFDDAVRDLVRARSRAGRDRAKAIGDVLYFGGTVLPTLLDGLIVTLGVRRAPDVAGQMIAINLQAYAITGATALLTENAIGRARPSAEPCERDPNYEAYCNSARREALSFISGHAALVSTSAGLMCAHHQHLRLYGQPWADALACGVGIAAALGTGLARMVNDRHYATDTLPAFAVGALSGYALPVLRFYATPTSAAQSWTLLPVLSGRFAGLTWAASL